MIRAGLIFSLFVLAQSASACTETSVTLRGEFGQARFNVEVADDPDERSQGLMFRESMATSSGMLFLYDSVQPLAFWMRNTLIELDMLFIDDTGTVRHIHQRAQPLDETVIPGGEGIAVLEINGGLSERLGLTVGAQVQHPFFGNKAAWPCG